ncbi:CubicO group peptidase, beta-lactamase class C family [Abditibacterium utsteinense]|uniref:CubicO group peptidase, beta-lactamase class C family n=1 Tax=Abditibacterium utsteinense TaxID=1960156 RepID=A0A2S8SWL8_9BACT|nr:serine hydrolase [Abditibacterium utsteinense]PQV65190.1 CubicO group peptidase, beta-lactamase class C family [Abditibacterium utsteinense]
MISTSVPLPVSSPEAHGISSRAILNFVDAIEERQLELHSLMLLRHGAVVAKGWWFPYVAQNPHVLYSLSKSFASTAAGMAISEGYFSLDDRVISFFPEQMPELVSENLAAMRVRDLLSMASGNAEDTSGTLDANDDWAKAFLARPVEYAPGTHFVYNSGATYMVSAIVQKTTGQTLLDWLQPRLFAPLGISGATWESCPRGINTGGWGLNLKTEDIARFGQLLLQKGIWNGKRLLDESWIESATSKQISNGDDAQSDWQQGYGFQFWMCRHGAYRGDGAFGQFCVVMPEQDAVLSITSNVGDMGAVLNLVWEHLLPAFSAAPLPNDEIAFQQLSGKLAQLEIAAPRDEITAEAASKISGKTFHFDPNEQDIRSIRFDFAAQATLTIEDAQGTHRVICGLNQWHSENTTWLQNRMWPRREPHQSWRLSARGAWTDAETFAIKLCFDETPFSPLLTCQFLPEGHLQVDLRGSIGFNPPEHAPLHGHLV